MQRNITITPHNLRTSGNPAVLKDQQNNFLVRREADQPSGDLFALIKRLPSGSAIRIFADDRFCMALHQQTTATREQLIQAIAQACPLTHDQKRAAFVLEQLENAFAEKVIFPTRRYMDATLSKDSKEAVRVHRIILSIDVCHWVINTVEEGFTLTRDDHPVVTFAADNVETQFDREADGDGKSWQLKKMILNSNDGTIARFLMYEKAPLLLKHHAMTGDSAAITAYNNENGRREYASKKEAELAKQLRQCEKERAEKENIHDMYKTFSRVGLVMMFLASPALLLGWPVFIGMMVIGAAFCIYAVVCKMFATRLTETPFLTPQPEQALSVTDNSDHDIMQQLKKTPAPEVKRTSVRQLVTQQENVGVGLVRPNGLELHLSENLLNAAPRGEEVKADMRSSPANAP